jgi:hypothetical protein
MLRILVISLVVANLFLLGFQDSKPEVELETVAPKRVSGDPRIPTIYLFSEIMEDEGLLTGSRQCFSIGPFHSVEDRNEVRSSLLEISPGIVERETQALVEMGYWVFMPPYISMLEANQELLSLKALGLKDIGIIYEGEWKNAISLGYFRRQGNAQSRKKGLEERGYQPQIRVQRQSESRYWLDYEQPPGSGRLSLDMQDRPNDFTQRSLPCPEQSAFDMTAADMPVPFEDLRQNEPVAENSAAQTEPPADSSAAENTLDVPDNELPTEPETDDAIEAEEIAPADPDDDTSGQTSDLEPGSTQPPEVDGV